MGTILEERVIVPKTSSASQNALDEFQREALEHLNALRDSAGYFQEDSPKAEDLLQQTYLNAFRFSHKFKLGTNPMAWLFTIMRNASISFYRGSKREPAVLDEIAPDFNDKPQMFQDAPEYNAQHLELRIDLEKALKKLPEENRRSLLLAELMGMQYNEIAELMDCPLGTVKIRIFRAKEKLRELLNGYDKDSMNHRTPALRTYWGLNVMD